MKLGIIAKPTEESFQYAAKKGLDFLEFCINKDDDHEDFFNKLGDITRWSESYGVSVGSVGRWKSERIHPDGSLIESELSLSYRLIDAAQALQCPHFVCGCNYIDELSYYQNCSSAIAYLSKLLDYSKDSSVKISTYNCRKGSFINNQMAWTLIHGHLPGLGIKFDSAHSRYDGCDYLRETADWGHRFNHVHLKGSMIVNGEKIDDPPAGLDQTDWKTFFTILNARGYQGGFSIEPHSSIWTGSRHEEGVDFTIGYMRSLPF